MSTQETALVKQETAAVSHETDRLTNLQRLGKILSASGYFSDAREMAQAAVKVMAGEELGIPPIASMMGVNIIKGKVALGGNLIASRIRAHGYDYAITRHDKQGCNIKFLSKPDGGGKRGTLGESSFTEEDAKAAQVFGDMYKKYPKNMYFNRAISNGAKWFTPEVSAGMPVYTPEELGATVDSEGDMVHAESQYSTGETKTEISDRRVAEVKQENGQEELAVVQEAWAKMTNLKASIETFGIIKGMLIKAMGTDEGESEYYRILRLYEVEHANGFKRLEPARMAAKDMLLAVEAAKEAAGV